MELTNYFAGLSQVLQAQSKIVRDAFKSHRPTAGDNREAIVENFFRSHLPEMFGVATGLIVDQDRVVSKQADLVIFDQLFTKPFAANLPNLVFPVESVFTVVEVKTQLTPTELADSISKCRIFKRMKRNFISSHKPKSTTSLFVVFAFEAANPNTFIENMRIGMENVPLGERPDLIVVPNSFVATSGNYYEITKIGELGSQYRSDLESKSAKLTDTLGKGFDLYIVEEHSLLTFYVWLTSWLTRAGNRAPDLANYLPDIHWGHRIS